MSAELEPVGAVARGRAAVLSDRFTGAALVLLLAAAFGLVGRQLWTIATGALPAAPGVEAPAFRASVLGGEPTSLGEHRGKVVLLDFWATWCPPCVASMPALQRAHERYQGEGLVVLGVNQEPNDLASVRAFVARRGLEFPIVVDEGEVAPAYGVFSFPTSVLVGRDGVIRAVHRGPVGEAQLGREIEAALAAGPGPAPAGGDTR
jgi:cytochrome c biogenesis protein CcmG/thiol:disulfide interchange protein DsbE